MSEIEVEVREDENGEQRAEETWKTKAKQKGKAALDWASKHKTEVIAGLTIAVPAVVDIVKIVAKKGANDDERELKERFVYDRSKGHYYETKRKLKSSEWLQIDQRRENGEQLGRILDDMGVLKR